MEFNDVDYIVNIDHVEFARRFAEALDLSDPHEKVTVYQLLSKICMHSCDGHAIALKILDQLQSLKKTRYRFSCVTDELKSVGSSGLRWVLLQAVNSIVDAAPTSAERVRLRNELIGLNILDILKDFSRKDADELTAKQIETFYQSKSKDDDDQLVDGVDLSSHLDVFYAILKQVSDTPHAVSFLSVLQHLLQIDAADVIGDVIWTVVDKLVAGAALLTHKSDADRLVADGTRRLERAVDSCRLSKDRAGCGTSCECVCHSRGQLDPSSATLSPSVARKLREADDSAACGDLNSTPNTSNLISESCPPPAPPLAPPLPGFAPAAPPPPPLLSSTPGGGLSSPLTPVPKPRHKMRTLQWNKLSAPKVFGHRNLWTITTAAFKNDTSAGTSVVDFEEMERLFAVDSGSKGSGAAGVDVTDSSADRKKKSDEVNLLDNKRSLNVNIFLRQFRVSHAEIVGHLASPCKVDDGKVGRIEMGVDRLRGLQRILPETDEVDMIRSYSGDTSKLGSAEKFYLELIKLPDYKFRVEALLVEAEFGQLLESIKPSIDAIIVTARDIHDNKLLQELIYIILAAGNFLNCGGYAGDAVGFKLSSLLKLSETRANKPGFTLLHFVAMTAEQRNPKLLTLPDQMKYIKEAAQFTIDSIASDVASLRTKVKSVSDQMKTSASKDFAHTMKAFIKQAQKDISELESDLNELEKMRVKLADFFCEEKKAFKLDECIKTFYEFFEKFRKAVQDNAQQAIAEEKAAQRKRQQEAGSLKNKFDSPKQHVPLYASRSIGNTSAVDSEPAAQNNPTNGELRTSTFTKPELLRFNSIDETNMNVVDKRNRRSKNSSNDPLLDFLHAPPAVLDDQKSVELEYNLKSNRRRSKLPAELLMDNRERATPVSFGSEIKDANPSRNSNDYAQVKESANDQPQHRMLTRSTSEAVQPSRRDSVGFYFDKKQEDEERDREYLEKLEKSQQRRRQLPVPVQLGDQNVAQVPVLVNSNGRNAVDDGALPSAVLRRHSFADRNARHRLGQSFDSASYQRANDGAASSVTENFPVRQDDFRSNVDHRGKVMTENESESNRRWTMSDIDQTILDMEQAGRDLDNLIRTNDQPTETSKLNNCNQHSTVEAQRHSDGRSSTQEDNTTSSLVAGERSPKNNLNGQESKRWGKVFDEDDVTGAGLQRSATLPRRWRPNVVSGCIPDSILENAMEEEELSVDKQDNHRYSSDTRSDTDTNYSASISSKPWFQTDDMIHRASIDSSRCDAESMSSGFESAVDISQSDQSSASCRDSMASSYLDSDNSMATRPNTVCSMDDIQEDQLSDVDDQMTNSVHGDVDELEDTGGRLFARSIDSIAQNHELVVSGNGINIDDEEQFGEHIDSFNQNDVTLIVSPADDTPDQVPDKQKSHRHSKSTGKSSFLDRLARPKWSSLSSSGSKTAKTEQKPRDAKSGASSSLSTTSATQPFSPRDSKTAPSASLSNTVTLPPSPVGLTPPASSVSPFVRGSAARTTMPASLVSANKKKAAAAKEILVKEPPPPEPPRRTTSIRDPAPSGTNVFQRLSAGTGLFAKRYPDDTSIASTSIAKAPEMHERPRRPGGNTTMMHKAVTGQSTRSTDEHHAENQLHRKTATQQSKSFENKHHVNATPSGHRTQRLSSVHTPTASKSVRC